MASVSSIGPAKLFILFTALLICATTGMKLEKKIVFHNSMKHEKKSFEATVWDVTNRSRIFNQTVSYGQDEVVCTLQDYGSITKVILEAPKGGTENQICRWEYALDHDEHQDDPITSWKFTYYDNGPKASAIHRSGKSFQVTENSPFASNN